MCLWFPCQPRVLSAILVDLCSATLLSCPDAHVIARVNEDSKLPDIQVGVFCTIPEKELVESNRPCKGFLDEFMKDSDNRHTQGLSLIPVLLHPKSRGFIKLKSSDPFDAPAIDPCYLSDAGEHDLKTLMKGVRLGHKIIKETEAMSALVDYQIGTADGCVPMVV